MKIQISALFLFFFILSSFAKVTNKDMKVISAQSQTIYGGVAGSPIVTRYTIQLKALRSFTLTKDSAYAQGKMDAFQIMEPSNIEVNPKKIKKGATITLVFSIVTPTEIGGAENQYKFPGSPEAKPPVKSASGVVIRYKGGKSRYIGVDKVTTVEPIMAP